MKELMRWMLVAVLTCGSTSNIMAQKGHKANTQDALPSKELKADVNRAAGIYYALPVELDNKGKGHKNAIVPFNDTPAPDGKLPFYINHYACPCSYYLDNAEDYNAPYAIFAKADSLGKLTPLGRDVKRRLALIREDALGRTGELTAKGAQQSRAITKRLIDRLPSAFRPDGYYSVRSIVKNRCILTMQEGMLQMSTMRHPISIRSRATKTEYPFMDPTDEKLTSAWTNEKTSTLFAQFASLNDSHTRLMEALFNDQNFIITHFDAAKLARQLFRLASSIQHTELAGKVTLFDIFTPDEIHRHWRRQNVLNYMRYGGYTGNGGTQPYQQRSTLRNMIHMGDSVLKRYAPLSHLRYTNEQVILALASLMELDNCGVQTDNLDSLEAMGWADYRIAPLGGSIVMIHYRKDHFDEDVLVKVLLNEREARLPIETDCAPYYHWNDVKRYYLRKLYRYENTRFDGITEPQRIFR